MNPADKEWYERLGIKVERTDSPRYVMPEATIATADEPEAGFYEQAEA